VFASDWRKIVTEEVTTGGYGRGPRCIAAILMTAKGCAKWRHVWRDMAWAG
jgi:hypothetical protein